MKCLADGKLMQPAGSLDEALGPLATRNKSVPRLAVDDRAASGCCPPSPAARRRRARSGSAPPALRRPGLVGALAPGRSTNLIDNRPALAAWTGRCWSSTAADHRANQQPRPGRPLRRRLELGPEARRARRSWSPTHPRRRRRSQPVHPTSRTTSPGCATTASSVGGKSLRLLRGEFHRHTEFTSHRDQDGLLEDTWRYALDAADLDWMGNGDHDNGFGHEYIWWLIQKMTDLHHNPPRFVAAQTYERSVVYPNGHRNVMMPRRGIRPCRAATCRARPRRARPTPSCSTPT